jgi:hypothetical protein
MDTAVEKDGMAEVGTVVGTVENGAALGLGLGLGLLGGALATAPYYAAPYYAAPGYGYAPAPAVPTTWYWCDPYQQYYPYVPSCPTAWRQVVQ